MSEEQSPPASPPVDALERGRALAAPVDRWFADHFPGSSVATVTEHFNYAIRAVEDLKRRLAEEI